ncbi:hypothetical protein IWQ60_007134 [Tieghemiomyces parasiticus]|uniref:Peptidase S8/S53 domain-containing protein n=1 Tax=Tieghemiomyces parasiticus TaxID=78921 RepID=A0A9W7ZZP6_9FUNG|nr:hypothetical protein IWQ60_007134 [Tieghemiomyces parasiticus]
MRCTALLGGLTALAFYGCAVAQLDATINQLNRIPNVFVVEYSGVAQFAQNMQDASIPFTVTRNYTTLLSGSSVTFDDRYQDGVTSLFATQSLWPIRTIKHADSPFKMARPLTTSLPPMPMLAHQFTGVAQLHSSYNLDGTGVKIGILDSGLDYNHPAFGNCYKTSGCRIQYGYDFVGDNFNGYNQPQPDDDPYTSCSVHGTHVAGIAAGSHGVFKGVAPKATLGIYRVMGCNGMTRNDVVASALDRAASDGMDIVNMSFGSPSGWSTMMVDEAIYRLGLRGVIAVAAVGNFGADTLWAVNSPATSNMSVAVGAVDLPTYYSHTMNVTVGTTKVVIPRSDQQHNLPPLNLNNAPLVRARDAGATTDLACGAITAAPGAVVLVQVGGCSDQVKTANVQAAGGVALALYHNQAGFAGYAGDVDNNAIPSFMLLQSDGQSLISLLATGAATVTINDRVASFTNSNPIVPSWYSSWGPGPDGKVKPEIMGPGSNVYSTIPLAVGGYGLDSGTSMATPYIAGVFALLKQSGKAPDRNAALQRILNTATIMYQKPNVPYSPALQGNGLVDMVKAYNTEFTVDNVYTIGSGYVSNLTSKFTLNFYLNNTSTRNVEYGYEFVRAQSVSSFFRDGTVAIPPHQDTSVLHPSYNVYTKPVPAQGSVKNAFMCEYGDYTMEDLLLGGGFLNLFPKPGFTGNNVTIPYLSYVYNSTNIPILDTSWNGFPLPSMINSATGNILGDGSTFTFVGEDVPVIVFRLKLPIYRVRIRLAKAATPSSIHGVVGDGHYRYLEKNMDSAGNPYYTYRWDGTAHPYATPTNVYNVPNGQYVLLLHFFPTGPTDTPTLYTSPKITIKRP